MQIFLENFLCDYSALQQQVSESFLALHAFFNATTSVTTWALFLLGRKGASFATAEAGRVLDNGTDGHLYLDVAESQPHCLLIPTPNCSQ